MTHYAVKELSLVNTFQTSPALRLLRRKKELHLVRYSSTSMLLYGALYLCLEPCQYYFPRCHTLLCFFVPSSLASQSKLPYHFRIRHLQILLTAHLHAHGATLDNVAHHEHVTHPGLATTSEGSIDIIANSVIHVQTAELNQLSRAPIIELFGQS